MISPTALGVAGGLGAALVFGLAAVAQARAVRRAPSPGASLGGFVAHGLRDATMWGVGLAYLGGFGLHTLAIRHLPLYLAQTLIAMSLPVTAVAVRLLGEHLSRTGWLAVAAVSTGTVLVGASSGSTGEEGPHPALTLSAVAAVAVVVAGTLARRRLRPVLLATVAGTGYAGVALAVRGAAPSGVPGLVCLAALPVCGVLTFWLYSLAMERGAVATATAALVAVQTLVPAVVGVSVLGDGVRSGWLPALVAGLVLAGAGAATLERRDAERPADETGTAEPGADEPTADEPGAAGMMPR